MSTFYGTAGKDVVQAEETPHDTFYGLGGGDEFYISTFGGGGYYFYGGDGNDRFSGGATVIWMADGGAGDDRFDLNGEYMRIEGGTGNDRIEGGADSADVFGGDGNDFVDVLSYPDNGDTVDGGAGNDILLVGNQNDERGARCSWRGRGARPRSWPPSRLCTNIHPGPPSGGRPVITAAATRSSSRALAPTSGNSTSHALMNLCTTSATARGVCARPFSMPAHSGAKHVHF